MEGGVSGKLCTRWFFCLGECGRTGINIFRRCVDAVMGVWLTVLLFMLSVVCHGAELRWDGEGKDGLWQNPLNWSSNSLPQNADDIVFDNSFIDGSYVVILGPGSGLISIRSIRITPSGANIITLTIPAANAEAPALKCVGAVYGLVLDRNSIFINESGASSGATIEVDDSIRINNGGRYVHRTARSHAETVRSLCRAPGTEEGEFEFNIPVASSTISLSGQVFGRLRLSPGPNGIINYTGTGTNDLTIRSDLEIMPGVNLSLNLEGKLHIERNLFHNGGVFNLASTARNLRLEIGGNFHQVSNAIVTESGSANPEIILNGANTQELEIKGIISNEVTLKIDNPGGVSLKNSLSLPFKLSMERGIFTTNQHVLSLQPSCLLEVSGTNTCFVDGRLEKKGLINASFFFPVGKNGVRRWLQVHQASGDFIVQYVRSDPRLFSTDYGPGISHISGLEYWSITTGGGSANAGVELSFDNVNSGGITDLANLRVARLNESSWQDAGNIATSGSAGSNGSVSSIVQNWTNSQPVLYALASNAASQNPLPITWKSFRAIVVGKAIRLEWITELALSSYYLVEKSPDGITFSALAKIQAVNGYGSYKYTDTVSRTTSLYYRVVMVKHDGSVTASKIIRVGPPTAISSQSVDNPRATSVFLSVDMLRIDFHDLRDAKYSLKIIDVTGRVIYRSNLDIIGGKGWLPLKMPVKSCANLFLNFTDQPGNNITLKTMVQ